MTFSYNKKISVKKYCVVWQFSRLWSTVSCCQLPTILAVTLSHLTACLCLFLICVCECMCDFVLNSRLPFGLSHSTWSRLRLLPCNLYTRHTILRCNFVTATTTMTTAAAAAVTTTSNIASSMCNLLESFFRVGKRRLVSGSALNFKLQRLVCRSRRRRPKSLFADKFALWVIRCHNIYTVTYIYIPTL